MKTVGDTLPSFELRDQNDSTVRHPDLQGHWMVLTCYPNNMTPGCSQEALS
jgi:peroxiredoxin